jgi:alkylation response protein AidB-like acyl-CoA dehydrogenase
MNLSFTPEQEAYRLRAREWLAANLPRDWAGGSARQAAETREGAQQLRAWERRLHEAGYAGIAWPKQYGGQGLGLIEHLIFAEEIGAVAAPESINAVGIELVGPVVLGAGTEEQKRELIPRILSARDVWCQGFSEPNAGSDLASVRTAAVRDGGEWVINGQKIWTSQATAADYCILLARTDSGAPRHLGLSLLIVPMDAPGLSITPLVQITGRTNFGQLFLSDVRIPADAHIGPLHSGWKVANAVLSFERGTMKLYRQARFLSEFGAMLDMARERHGPAALADGNGFYAQKFAEAYAELAILRWHNLQLLSRIMEGDRAGAETSLNKVYWSELYQRLTELGLDVGVAGPSGREPDMLDLYLQSRSATIASGTTQIQLNIIAERVLGLPRG